MTAEKWVPIVEVPVNSLKLFLEKKKREGFSILGLEQTANSVSLDKYQFPKKTVSLEVFFYFSLTFPMEVKKDLVDDHCCVCCLFRKGFGAGSGKGRHTCGYNPCTGRLRRDPTTRSC